MDNTISFEELLDKLGIRQEYIDSQNKMEYAMEPYEIVEMEDKEDVND